MIQELVCISPPLNDHKGKRLGGLLFTYLFDLAGLNDVMFEEVQQGSLSRVKYFLRLPSGTECLYSGYPDFTYAIGNLHTTFDTSNLTTVILLKDFTACLALASLDRTKANAEIMGETSYKLIRPCSWKLNEPDELMDFAKIFISTMKHCLRDTFPQ